MHKKTSHVLLPTRYDDKTNTIIIIYDTNTDYMVLRKCYMICHFIECQIYTN